LSSFDIARVRALRTRDERTKTGCYAIEGVRFLVAASDAGATFVGIAVCEKLLGSVVARMIVRRLRRRGVPTIRIGEAEYSAATRLTDGTGLGVVAVVRQRWRSIDRFRRGELWLAVESVRSPGNLGTLMRTCLAVGARGVIVVGDADLHDPACVRATMGALESLELVRMSPSALVALARATGAQLVGASPDGTCDFRCARYEAATIVLVGSERKGLSEPMRRACDLLVRIPMVGRIDSLNVAVAGSLILYEAFSHRTS
jgi:TrmH family RNA methyltransferase